PLIHVLLATCSPRRHLHSFPTRRSSDLTDSFAAAAQRFGEAFDPAEPEDRDPRHRPPPIRFGEAAADDRRAAIAGGREHRPLPRSEEHTSELQSQSNLVCRPLLEKKKKF